MGTALDVRLAQNTLENAIRDAILFALGYRLPAVASITDLRALTTRGATSTQFNNDHLVQVVVASVVQSSWRWNRESTATDDGATVIKPADVQQNGRWLRWTSPMRIAPIPGGNSMYLHEVQSGVFRRVIGIDKGFEQAEMDALLSGSVPAVWIEATGDNPTEATTNTGHRWDTEFEFKISILDENLRDRRQAAQGSLVPGDPTLGANGLDGIIQTLLGGIQLQLVVGGVRDVRCGECRNLLSDLGERRIIRERTYRVKATVENPPAPNDTYQPTEVDLTPEMADLGQQDSLDPLNHVIDGIAVDTDFGLTQPISAGSALINGASVVYAGTGGHAFDAYSDTYIDLLPDGTLAFVPVSGTQDPPDVTPTALRVGVARTSSNSVVGYQFIASRKKPFGSVPVQVPL